MPSLPWQAWCLWMAIAAIPVGMVVDLTRLPPLGDKR